MDAYEKRKKNILKWVRDDIRAKKHSPGMQHVATYHVNRDKNSLKNRCIMDGKIHASTFLGDADDVTDMLVRVMLGFADEIAGWLADDSDFEEWYIEERLPAGPVGGIMYSNTRAHDWADGALECDSVVIVLVKCSPQNSNDFDIKTAYAACRNFA
ncbi:MAG: hypothetical protein LUE14_04010 [Clostridiales bacterium]|nr:hypothetical protein [Clostridiales bacterium]